MPGPEPLVTPAEISRRTAQGLNYSEIAKLYGMTRQGISRIAVAAGMNPKSEVELLLLEHFPWEVPTRFQGSVYKRLRDHAIYKVYPEQVAGWDEARISGLRSFYRRLGTDVIEFDPDLPGIPGWNKPGGFAQRPRELRDDGLIVRVNDYTTMTDFGYDLWTLPEDTEPL